MHADGTPELDLPRPSLTLSVEVSSDAQANEAALVALPAKPGVLIIEDESGSTLSLLQTADLRRAARSRLGPVEAEQQGTRRSRRVELRSIAKRVVATTVGSTFEADWATLQLARIRLPHSYKSMLDRWQAWFLHCNPDDQFPQWVKTSDPASTSGVHIGPIGDKHAAARFREMLEDAFDLCRFHHILVQAPHGTACVYKEMGRCPAPCDGTVSMQHYHQQIRSSIEFGRQPADSRASWEASMRERSAAMDFEGAGRCKTLLERTAMSERNEFAQVRDFDAFRFIAVLPGELEESVRLFAIVGGWIEPILDHSEQSEPGLLADALRSMRDKSPHSPGRSENEIENIGLVCRHLLLPRAQAKRRRAEFLRWNEHDPTPAAISKAIARVLRVEESSAESASPAPESELELTA